MWLEEYVGTICSLHISNTSRPAQCYIDLIYTNVTFDVQVWTQSLPHSSWISVTFGTCKTRYVTFRSKGRLFKVQYRVFKTKLGTLGCWPPPLLFRTWSLQKSFLSPFLWKSDYDSEQLASKFRDQMRPVHWCLMISMLASPRELIKCLHEIGSFKIAQLDLKHLFPSH